MLGPAVGISAYAAECDQRISTAPTRALSSCSPFTPNYYHYYYYPARRILSALSSSTALCSLRSTRSGKHRSLSRSTSEAVHSIPAIQDATDLANLTVLRDQISRSSSHRIKSHHRILIPISANTVPHNKPYQRNQPTMSAEASSAGYDFQLYRHTPSLAAAVISTILFAIVSGLHLWKLLRHRALYFTAFLIGGICTYCPHQHPVLRG